MIYLKMKRDVDGSADGIRCESYKKDQEYCFSGERPEDLARLLLKNGDAEEIPEVTELLPENPQEETPRVGSDAAPDPGAGPVGSAQEIVAQPELLTAESAAVDDADQAAGDEQQPASEDAAETVPAAAGKKNGKKA